MDPPIIQVVKEYTSMHYVKKFTKKFNSQREINENNQV